MDISKIYVNGSQYDIKDTVARTDAAAALQAASGTIHLLGSTTTELSDNAEISTIMVDGDSVTAAANDAVFYGNKEYVFDGTKWHEFGDMTGLGSVATKDSLTGNYTPAGTNAASAVSFSGTTDSNFVTGVKNAAVLPSFTEGAFSAGTLPSFTEGAFDAGELPSLGAATTSAFATAGLVASYNSSDEALNFTNATTADAVTAQGAFSAGSLPSKAADTFMAGSLPSKAADTFNAGSAATYNTAKAITSIGTATAAAQVFTGTPGTITVA